LALLLCKFCSQTTLQDRVGYLLFLREANTTGSGRNKVKS